METQTLDFTEENGLVLCGKVSAAQNSYERLYVAEVIKLGVYAVFFRRFFKRKDDTKAYRSEPVVCIFKEEDVHVNSPKHKEIHAALWSEGKIDIYIISGKTRLDIYNVRKPAERVRENEISVENLRFTSEVVEALDKESSAARLFGTGTFWEQDKYRNQINIDKSPYVHLIDYLMKVRKNFNQISSENLEPEIIDKILVLSILVKFLEEKRDSFTNESTLDEIFSKYQVHSFVEAVESGNFLAVLEALSTEFNGRVFDQFSPDEKEQIEKADLRLLAQFLRSENDLDTKQLFLWKQYSFQHLPAEVISAIYENFIQEEAERDGNGREKGVVYTPIHLVNFMVDEVMPLENPPLSFTESGIYKILDPTCGSGVFLVAAYKRLLQWWAIAKSEETGEIQYPDVLTAQKILEDNIFGVDVKKTAVRVTIFGLTTALLDYLTPKQVWGKLKFQDLSTKNIVEAKPPTGFFQWALDAKNEGRHFSLVIGNPPFNPEKNSSKQKVLDKDVLNSLDLKHSNIPRNNFALHFFEASMLLTDRVCMIIPSNALLYDKSAKKYRRELFTDYTISDIFDFTHLRRGLFTSADTPVVTLIANNEPSEFQPINHTVVKRTLSVEQRVRFEIDDYDRHLVKWDWAVDPDKQFVWKTNLLGGGRLFHLIYRLTILPTLKSFLESKKIEGWKEIRGFEGGDKLLVEKCDKILSIGGNGYPEIIYDTAFRTANLKDTFMYEPPFMLIDQVFGSKNIPVLMIPSASDYTKKSHLYYNRDFIGISVPVSSERELVQIYNLFKVRNKLQLNYQLYVLAISSSAMVLTETDVNKGEILDVPFQDDFEAIQLSDSEAIIQKDVLDYYINLGKQIMKASAGSTLHHPVKEKQIEEYGEVLCSELNDIYAKNGNSWQSGKIYRMPSYTVYQIGFGVDGKLKQEFVANELDGSIEILINNDATNRGAAYKRIVRLYNHVGGFDCVYFIKPNALRYWLKSIALRDADETFLDFKAEDY